MSKAKPLSEDASSADEPSRNDGVTMPLCGLCGEPIERGNVAQAMVDLASGGVTVRAHLRCYREREIMRRVMRPASGC